MGTNLGWILTDARIRIVWIGGRTVSIDDADMLAVPRWDEYQLARRAAKALRISGFKLVPTMISLPARKGH